MMDWVSNGRIGFGGAGGGIEGLVSAETGWMVMPTDGSGALVTEERTIVVRAGELRQGCDRVRCHQRWRMSAPALSNTCSSEDPFRAGFTGT